ncbi:MAG: glycosyltransferase family 2 protein, partial [Streptosporangiales bacterium]|nr:glycosyltransferase family 2 protein [Streptosporangiales bacterium]
GFQLIFFWLFTQVYAGSEGFLPHEPSVQRILGKLSLERGLVFGVIIGLAGLAGLIFSLVNWQASHFGALNYEHSLRLVVPSVTALMISFQLIFGAFFLSILGIKQTRHTSIEAEKIGTPADNENAETPA